MTEPTNRGSTSATSGQRLPPRVWKLGDFCRVWRGATLGDHDAGGYEHGIIETLCEHCGSEGELHPELAETNEPAYPCPHCATSDVMLVGDSGREIFCQVKDLEAG